MICSFQSLRPFPSRKARGSYSLRSLDVAVLHTLILEKKLGIDKENMAKADKPDVYKG